MWIRCFVALFLFTTVAYAQPTGSALDQSSVVSFPTLAFARHCLEPERSAAQTFTVGATGTLERIDLQLLAYAATTLPVRVEVRRLSDGVPSDKPEDLLAWASISPNDVAQKGLEASELMTAVDLRTWQLDVLSGDQLAIVMRGNEPCGMPNPGFPGNGTWWIGTAGALPPDAFDLYPGGTAFDQLAAGWRDRSTRGGFNDWGFRTYVAVPEPLGLVLFVVPMLLLASRTVRTFPR